MRVGLNFLYYIPEEVGGVGIFGRELLRALPSVDPETQYVIFTSRDGKELLHFQNAQIEVVVCPFDARHRFVRYLWEQLILPFQVLRNEVDVLHSLSYVGPVISPVPTILTIHDANSRAIPNTMPLVRRAMLWLVSRLASRAADRITTVSRFSRGELARWYKIPEERIAVVLSGPGQGMGTPCSPTAFAKLKEHSPYIAAIGGSYPHKNIGRLIAAYKRIQDRIAHKLLIIGRVSDDAMCEIGPHNRNIILTGYLSDADVTNTIRLSDLFVMPSLYEGFGFPVLEAQCQDVPVACSSSGALPEIVGDSAVLFDPENVDEIASSILHCVTDRDVNRRMRRSSAENAARFSWSSAAETYHSYYKVCSHNRQSAVHHAIQAFWRVIWSAA